MTRSTSPVVVEGMWGPNERKATAGASYKHLGIAVASVLGASIVTPIIAVVFLRVAGAGISDPQVFAQSVANWFSTGPGMTVGLALTWLGLLIPVLIAGRATPGGWKKLVRWGFRWKVDIPVAVGFMLVFRGVEFGINALLTHIGVDVSHLSNGGMLSDSGRAWVPILGLCATIGAPFFEELHFRGLWYDVLARKIGPRFGTVASGLAFGLMHMQATLAASIYTVSLTALLGITLAWIARRTGRIGTTVAAHALFNGSAAVLTLLGV